MALRVGIEQFALPTAAHHDQPEDLDGAVHAMHRFGNLSIPRSGSSHLEQRRNGCRDGHIAIGRDRKHLTVDLAVIEDRRLVRRAVRKVIYTTNAIESLNSQVRKAIRNKGHFPNDDAATKRIWLALRLIESKWKTPPIFWHAAKAQLAIQFEDRFILSN